MGRWHGRRLVQLAVKTVVAYFRSITQDQWKAVLKEFMMMYWASIFVLPLASSPVGRLAYVAPFPTSFIRVHAPLGTVVRQAVTIEAGVAVGVYYAVAVLYVFPDSAVAQCSFLSALVFVIALGRARFPSMVPAFTATGLLAVIMMSTFTGAIATAIPTATSIIVATAVGVGTAITFSAALFPQFATLLYRYKMAEALKTAASIVRKSQEVLLSVPPPPPPPPPSATSPAAAAPSSSSVPSSSAPSSPIPSSSASQSENPARSIPGLAVSEPLPLPPSYPPPQPPGQPSSENVYYSPHISPQEISQYSSAHPYATEPAESGLRWSPSRTARTSTATISVPFWPPPQETSGTQDASSADATGSSQLQQQQPRIISTNDHTAFLPSEMEWWRARVHQLRQHSGPSRSDDTGALRPPAQSPLSPASPSLTPLVLPSATQSSHSSPSLPARRRVYQPMIDITPENAPPPLPLVHINSHSSRSSDAAISAQLNTISTQINKTVHLLATVQHLLQECKYEFGQVVFRRSDVQLAVSAHARLMQLVMAVGEFTLQHHSLRASCALQVTEAQHERHSPTPASSIVLSSPSSQSATTYTSSSTATPPAAQHSMANRVHERNQIVDAFLDVFEAPLATALKHLADALEDLSGRAHHNRVAKDEYLRWPDVNEPRLGHSPRQRELLSFLGLGPDLHPFHYLIYIVCELRAQVRLYATCQAHLREPLPWRHYFSPAHWLSLRSDIMSSVVMSAGMAPISERMLHIQHVPQTGAQRLGYRLWKFAHIFETNDFRYALKTTIAFVILAYPFFLIPGLRHFRFYWALFTVISVSTPIQGSNISSAINRLIGLGLAVGYAIPTWLAASQSAVGLAGMFVPYFVVAAFLKGATPYFRLSSQMLITYVITVLALYVNRDVPGEDSIYVLVYERTVATAAGIITVLIVGRVFWPFLARVELRKVVARAIYDANMAWIQTNSLFSQGYIKPADMMMLVRILSILQNDLTVANGLLEWTNSEPRIKGPFKKYAFVKILKCLQLIHNNLATTASLIDRGVGIELRSEVLVWLKYERREFFVTIAQLFHVLASSVRTKFPLPAFVPDPASSIRRMLKRLQSLDAMEQRFPPEYVLHYFAFMNVLKEIAHELDLIRNLVLDLYGYNRQFTLTSEDHHYDLRAIV